MARKMAILKAKKPIASSWIEPEIMGSYTVKDRK
jgi:hypothetical protein